MSLRGSGSDRPCSIDPTAPSTDPEHDAICRSVAAGITYVVAAGNDSTDASRFVPAAYEEVITVSALADTDGRRGGSGPLTCLTSAGREIDDIFAKSSNRGPDIDLIAPGACILSLARDPAVAGPAGAPPGTKVMSGTSMSAPTVAGAAARYLATYPGTSPAGVRTALRAAATLDWAASTDPDGDPDRLLDVAGVDGPVALALWSSPTELAFGSGAADAAVAVHLTRSGGFDGTVTLTVEAPSAIGATLDDWTLSGLGGVTSTLHLSVAAGAATGDHEVRIDAATSTGLTARTTLIVRVDHAPPVLVGPRRTTAQAWRATRCDSPSMAVRGSGSHSPTGSPRP
ncbi:MAG: S8 family serine peptidase [Chloroflexi bacterium]|nr:S8 family serine peptidase [Chloroflexota bacterium]